MRPNFALCIASPFTVVGLELRPRLLESGRMKRIPGRFHPVSDRSREHVFVGKANDPRAASPPCPARGDRADSYAEFRSCSRTNDRSSVWSPGIIRAMSFACQDLCFGSLQQPRVATGPHALNAYRLGFVTPAASKRCSNCGLPVHRAHNGCAKSATVRAGG